MRNQKTNKQNIETAILKLHTDKNTYENNQKTTLQKDFFFLFTSLIIGAIVPNTIITILIHWRSLSCFRKLPSPGRRFPRVRKKITAVILDQVTEIIK